MHNSMHNDSVTFDLRWLVASLTFFLLVQTSQAEFPGWQGLRVIEQKGRPDLMRAADLDGDAQEEIIVINSRSSRLDIYSWHEPAAADESRAELQPNELPLAPDLTHEELQLESVPRDVVVQDLDGDHRPELVVLVTSPNRVLVYQWREPGNWKKQYRINLLDGEIPTRRNVLLTRKTDAGQQLLVSMDNGIQQLLLQSTGRAEWLTPREKRSRVDWWLADLDGDGIDDLVEQTRESSESLRWYRATVDGALTPASVLHDRSVKDAALLRTGTAAELVVLDGSVKGILRRFKLDRGKATPFGEQHPLALDDGLKAVWSAMYQGDQRSLVVADSSAPRLLSYTFGKNGWQKQRSYPALTDIRALAPLAAEPGTLLLWTKEASDLRVSRWQSDRLTYPEPWQQSTEVENRKVEDRKILALSTVGSITWWAQKVGKHLDLFVARPQQKEPTRIRFANVGSKADQVLWIGGQRALVKEKNGRALKLFSLQDDQVKVTSPTHLKKASLAEFKLMVIDQEVRLGRLTDGVLQWLGEDLRSHEQVMLPQGQQLSDYVAIDEANGWALQRDSEFVHRIRIDDSRLSQSVERVKVPDAAKLLNDPILGMLLAGTDRVTRLDQGRTLELKLVDVVDERVGRAGGVRKTRFHKLSTTDIDRDGREDLVLYDQLQHRLTVLGSDDLEAGNLEAGDHTLRPIIAWPVFDDKKYPYSDDSDNLVKEPRAVLAADLDGDRLQDLAILSHDRLIIYLAREKS